jgi:hypothetical protein
MRVRMMCIRMTAILCVFFSIFLLLALSPSFMGEADAAERLSLSDLVYQGAFRLPSGQFGGSSFAYGGTALAFNPANNSLFMVGHDWDQMVAEVRIPQIINSSNLSSLATATVLQPFTDASEGKMYTVDSGTIKVGGLMVYGGQLYGTAYPYYDADASQVRSHFVSSLKLATQGDARGMYQVGTSGAGFVSGYMAAIPAEWQSSLGGPALTGQCCLSIISRTSSGPAAFAFNPSDLGVKNPVPATPLVYYPLNHPLAPGDTQNPSFNLSTEMGGVVFAPGTRSVLFIGRHGTGSYCYGTGGSSGGDCYDPSDGSKGIHAYPYVHQIWAYDVQDFIAVRNGQKQAWDIRPYGIWTFNLPFATSSKRLRGVAYDSQTRRLFISQYNGDGEKPVIHVFAVNAGVADVTPPSPPTALSVR